MLNALKNYLKKRITQPTTILGLISATALLSTSGLVYSPELVSMLLASAGLVQIDEQSGN